MLRLHPIPEAPPASPASLAGITPVSVFCFQLLLSHFPGDPTRAALVCFLWEALLSTSSACSPAWPECPAPNSCFEVVGLLCCKRVGRPELAWVWAEGAMAGRAVSTRHCVSQPPPGDSDTSSFSHLWDGVSLLSRGPALFSSLHLALCQPSSQGVKARASQWLTALISDCILKSNC